MSVRDDLWAALGTFQLDCRRYPTEAERLDALLKDPGIDGWDGPYWPAHRTENLAMCRYRVVRGEPELIEC